MISQEKLCSFRKVKIGFDMTAFMLGPDRLDVHQQMIEHIKNSLPDADAATVNEYLITLGLTPIPEKKQGGISRSSIFTVVLRWFRSVGQALGKALTPKQAVSCLVPRWSNLDSRLRELGIPARAIKRMSAGYPYTESPYRAVRIYVDLSIPTEDGRSLEMTGEGVQVAYKKKGIPYGSDYWKTEIGYEMARMMIDVSENHTEFPAVRS